MKPISLTLKNFFSHKNSKISLKDISSCLLVGNIEGDYSKSNGSGKSAVFEAITWSLFNNSRSSSKNDNIRWGQDSCKVEIEFLHEDEKYKVVRERYRKSSTSNVYFFRENSLEEWTDLTKETATETNNYIMKVIGMDYKTFLNTVYFRQNDISEFAEADPGSKKEIIKNIVDISKWDVYEKKAKEKLREFKIKLKVLSEDLESFEVIESEKKEAEENLEEQRQRLIKISELKSRYDKDYEVLMEEYLRKESELDTNLFDKTLEKIRYFSDMIVKNENILRKDRKELDAFSAKKEAISEKFDSMKMKVEAYVEEPNLEDKLDDIKARMLDKNSEFKYLTNLVKDLSGKTYSDDFCNHCSQPVSKDHIEYIKSQDSIKLEENKDKLISLKKDLSFMKSEKDSLEMNLKQKQNISIIREKLDSSKEKIDFYSSNIDTLNKSISMANDRILDFTGKKEEQERILESLKDSDFSKVKDRMKTAKDNKNSIDSERLEVIKKIGAYEQEIKNIDERVVVYKEKSKDLSELTEKVKVYSRMAKYFGKTGIQTVLLNNFLEDLEDETNRVVKKIGLPFSISIDTQMQGSKGDVKETLEINIRKDGHYHKFDSLSGGEKAKIALSLRFGLSFLCARYGGGDFEFLMLDEINSPLDRDGVENLMESIINAFEDELLVMMITHDESLKESFSDIIEVTKVNGESNITVTKV